MTPAEHSTITTTDDLATLLKVSSQSEYLKLGDMRRLVHMADVLGLPDNCLVLAGDGRSDNIDSLTVACDT